MEELIMNLELFLKIVGIINSEIQSIGELIIHKKDRYNLKNNSVSIKPFKSVKFQWWNDYRAESEKTLPRGTTLDIEFKRSGENEELHTSLFPGTREGRAINLSRVGGKSSELKTFKITRITPNKDSKYNYTIRNSN